MKGALLLTKQTFEGRATHLSRHDGLTWSRTVLHTQSDSGGPSLSKSRKNCLKSGLKLRSDQTPAPCGNHCNAACTCVAVRAPASSPILTLRRMLPSFSAASLILLHTPRFKHSVSITKRCVRHCSTRFSLTLFVRAPL